MNAAQESATAPQIITVGHGTTPSDEFADLLQQAGIETVVDVRTAPGSRRNPQFGKDALAQWLPEHGIDYRWEQRLGGFRKAAADSPDTAIRHPSFRAYAGHMRSEEFLAGITALLNQATETQKPVAIMCSETVWWRCHRRMIADYLTLARGLEVQNLMPGTNAGQRVAKLTPHSPMPAARVAETPAGPELIYDVADP